MRLGGGGGEKKKEFSRIEGIDIVVRVSVWHLEDN